MGIKLSSAKVDVAKERGGDWIEVDHGDWPGVAFKVKSTQNPMFKTAYEALLRKLGNKYKRKPIPPDELQVEIGRLYHEHILIDWRGITDDDGKAIAYDSDLAEKFMTEPEWRQIFDVVAMCASEVGKARIEAVEDAAKN